MTFHGSIPFGKMYCTFTTSYCTQLGHTLDDDQLIIDVVKAIKKKDEVIVTSEERELLKMVKKVKHQVGRSGPLTSILDWIGNIFS